MLNNKIFKVLANENRVKILKLIAERQYTLTDISKKLNISVANAKEHLEKLEQVNFIKKIEEGRKWKYYILTNNGSELLTNSNAEAKKFIILFIFSLVGLLGSMFLFINFFGVQTTEIHEYGLDKLATEQGQGNVIATYTTSINKFTNKDKELINSTQQNETKTENRTIMKKNKTNETVQLNETVVMQEKQDLVLYILLGLMVVFAFLVGYSIFEVRKKRVF